MNAFHRCRMLWKKANKPKSGEMVQVLIHTLSGPGKTARWNFTYDPVSQIVKEKEKLPVDLEKYSVVM